MILKIAVNVFQNMDIPKTLINKVSSELENEFDKTGGKVIISWTEPLSEEEEIEKYVLSGAYDYPQFVRDHIPEYITKVRIIREKLIKEGKL